VTVAFVEVGDRVHVLRYPVLDVNVTLVVGDGAALLVDSLSTAAQAAELVAAARRITRHPWSVVNTHHHFDHCFGNATVAGDPPGPIHAHQETLRLLRDHPDEVRRNAYDEMRPTEPALAAELLGTRILAPDHPVRAAVELDVGGRPVVLRHLGLGHTAGDLVVEVPDADVLVAGDLVEEGGPPDFAESYPLRWPATVAALLRLGSARTVVVPGHGAPLDPDRVRGQHDDLATLARLIRDGYAEGVPAQRLAARAPFGPGPALPAIRRGYTHLADRTHC
jgi:glyoxylase-like metal-dependent hydrolase (beta-lactamase superfamily II)